MVILLIPWQSTYSLGPLPWGFGIKRIGAVAGDFEGLIFPVCSISFNYSRSVSSSTSLRA
jgi:hypothetical protein